MQTAATALSAPLSLHEEVAGRLRELIYDGELPPGAFVNEPALCERLAISRTPLREALKVLTAEGLIRHEPRRMPHEVEGVPRVVRLRHVARCPVMADSGHGERLTGRRRQYDIPRPR